MQILLYVATLILNIYMQACDLLQGLIPHKDDKDTSALSKDHYERLYIFTLMWSIGKFQLSDPLAQRKNKRKEGISRLETVPFSALIFFSVNFFDLIFQIGIELNMYKQNKIMHASSIGRGTNILSRYRICYVLLSLHQMLFCF